MSPTSKSHRFSQSNSMPLLITSDIHLSDNRKDEYRWLIFPFLLKVAKERGATAVILAGDLTDKKDNHSSALVNRVVDNLQSLTAAGLEVYMLKGNHDYHDSASPFFQFIQHIPGVHFIGEVCVKKMAGLKVGFLPHVRISSEWGTIKEHMSADLVVLHQPLIGSKLPTGTMDTGTDPRMFDAMTGLVFSGDIHTTQKVRNVQYCGSPHHVSFGEDHKPGIWSITKGKAVFLENINAPRKYQLVASTVDELCTAKPVEGDMVKITLLVSREEFGAWQELRRAALEVCKEREWVCAGVNMRERSTRKRLISGDETQPKVASIRDTLRQYAQQQKIKKDLLDAGLAILPPDEV